MTVDGSRFRERASALLALIGLIGVVGWRTSRGEFPTTIANVEYRLSENIDAADALEQRVWILELFSGLRPLDRDDNEEEA